MQPTTWLTLAAGATLGAGALLTSQLWLPAGHASDPAVAVADAGLGPQAPLTPLTYDPRVSLAPLVDRLGPAVVNLTVSQKVTGPDLSGVPAPFREFFGVPGGPGGGQERVRRGQGSGFIISEDGYILTNNHVVTLDGATATAQLEVTTSDGHIYSATIVGTDAITDLAVIKLEDASGLTPIDTASSSELNVGDRTVVIGAPLGLSNSVSDGIVSALNRSISVASSAVPDDSTGDAEGSEGPQFNFDFPGSTGTTSSSISIPVIQTDAAVNPGNSGGALLNDEGELIGIIVAIASTGSDSSSTSGSIGVGFAIPSDLALRVAEDLMTDGTASHGLLGVTVGNASSDTGSTLGAVVGEVTPGSGADAAGIQSGDVITYFNELPITSATDITAQVRALAAGTSTTITVVRDEQVLTFDVTLGSLE